LVENLVGIKNKEKKRSVNTKKKIYLFR
jgi:hypothetical protein